MKIKTFNLFGSFNCPHRTESWDKRDPREEKHPDKIKRVVHLSSGTLKIKCRSDSLLRADTVRYLQL